MRHLNDDSVLTRHPAIFRRGMGTYRQYIDGGPLKILSESYTSNLYNKSLLCTYLLRSTYDGNPAFFRCVNPPYFTLEYIQEGEAYIRSGKFAYIAEAGDICLLHPQVNHELLIAPARKCEKVAMNFWGDGLNRILETVGLNNVNVIHFPDTGRFDDLVSRLQKTHEGNATSALHDLNAGIVFELFQALATEIANSKQEIPSELVAVMNEIKENLERPLSMAEVAEEHGMSIQTLNAKFKKHLYITAYQFIIRERMTSAVHYLKEGKLSIKEIASKVGFENQMCFSTAFKKYYGKSPRQYLMSGMQESITTP